MLRSYDDIISRLGEPLWWDNNGAPRYEPFDTKMCGVYWRQVCFYVIACQDCGKEFEVASELDQLDLFHAMTRSMATVVAPTEKSIGSFHYGDPPAHGCVGDTMNSVPVKVLEYWDRSQVMEPKRIPEHEIVFLEDAW